MADYLTGRTRILTCSGVITADLAYRRSWMEETHEGPPSSEILITRAGAGLVITALGCTFTCVGDRAHNLGGSGGNWLWRPTWTVTAEIGAALDTDTQVLTGSFDMPMGSPNHADWEPDISGTWEITVSVEEVVTITIDGDAWGHTSGQPDPPAYASVRRWERVVPGSTITATITSGTTATASYTLAADETWEVAYDVTLSLSAESEAKSNLGQPGNNGWTVAGLANTVTATPTLFAALSVPYSESSTDGHATAGDCSVHVDAASVGTAVIPPDHFTAEGSYGVRPPRSYDMEGVVRAMKVAYPANLEAIVYDDATIPSGTVVSIVGGAFSRSHTQRYYDADATLNGEAQDALSLHEWAPVSCKLRSSALIAAGEVGNDDRLPLRGWRWDAASIVQAASVSLLAGGASATWDPSPDVQLGSYAYADVGIATDAAGESVVLTLTCPQGSKGWSATSHATPGATKTIRIDLCAPDLVDGVAPTATTDDTDSRYPEDGADGADGYNTTEGRNAPWWGFERLQSAALTGGTNPRIVSVSLVRKAAGDSGRSRVTLLQSLRWWVTEKPRRYVALVGTYTDYYTSRFLQGETDGKQSLDEAALRYQVTVGGETGITTTTYFARSIEDLCTRASHTTFNAGWTMTDLLNDPETAAPTPPALWDLRDDFLNSSREAAHLWGAGMLCKPTGWEYGFDLDAATAAKTLPGQFIFDVIDGWPPDSGDAFGHVDDAASGALPLRCAQTLRGSAHGLTLDAARLRNDAVTVSLTESSGGAARGTGDSDALGFYETGTPFGIGQVLHDIAAAGTPPPTVSGVLLRTRKRHRASFMTVPTGEGISVDTNAAGRTARAQAVGSDLRLGVMTDVAGAAWEDLAIGVTGSNPCVRWDPARGRLWLAYESGGAVLLRRTDDEGRAMSVPTTVAASGTRPALAIHPSGQQYHYWRDAGAIKGKILDAFGGTVEGPFTCVASGVDDDAIAATWDSPSRRFYLLYRASGALLVRYSADGMTWT